MVVGFKEAMISIFVYRLLYCMSILLFIILGSFLSELEVIVFIIFLFILNISILYFVSMNWIIKLVVFIFVWIV